MHFHGKIFTTVEDYLTQTKAIRGLSGFKESIDEKDKTIVELFRNCNCGSTLMEEFKDRRDTSPNGLLRRNKFGLLLDRLKEAGFETNIARQELLKIVHGKDSELLKEWLQHLNLDDF